MRAEVHVCKSAFLHPFVWQQTPLKSDLFVAVLLSSFINVPLQRLVPLIGVVIWREHQWLTHKLPTIPWATLMVPVLFSVGPSYGWRISPCSQVLLSFSLICIWIRYLETQIFVEEISCFLSCYLRQISASPKVGSPVPEMAVQAVSNYSVSKPSIFQCYSFQPKLDDHLNLAFAIGPYCLSNVHRLSVTQDSRSHELGKYIFSYPHHWLTFHLGV